MIPLIRKIGELAGPQRSKTFMAAAEFILSQKNPILVETGCYRGNPADGMSTLILALLAQEARGQLISLDLHESNISKAHTLLEEHGCRKWATFVVGDSAITLRDCPREVAFAYPDSYDFEVHKAVDAQAHSLVEVGLLLPRMASTSAFLFDDCDLPLGGKPGMSLAPVLHCGYRETATGYQRLFVRP